VSIVANFHCIKLIIHIPLKSADHSFTLYKIIILPEKISPDKFAPYAIDYPYLTVQVSQHGHIPFTEKNYRKCVRSSITVCPLDSAIFNTQRLTCAANLFFQSPNRQQLCKRNLLLNYQQSTLVQHRNATTTDITLPGELSQSSPHTSTRERRIAIQRTSLPCVYRRFAYVSYTTRIYADGT